MRMLSKVLAGAVAAATTVALTAGPALADPPSGVTPRPQDVVGTGSDTTQYVMDQLALNYDTANPSAANKIYSWDAVNPDTLAIGDNIVTKSGCAAIARPDGSGAGIGELADNILDPTKVKGVQYYCEDYARSSRARETTDPPYSKGGVAFVAFAGDAVTWADRDVASGGTDAPASLTAAQLVKIFECTDTNWDQVGGKDAPILAYLPQTSSGTRAFWLTALGGGTTPITPGSCVSDLPTSEFPDGTLEENEGINSVYDSPEAIGIFSVGAFLSQMYHSPACSKAACTPNKTGDPCPLAKGSTLNAFGCDETGYLQINELGGTKKADQPATPWPLTSSTTTATINPKFQTLFQRTLFNVVRFDPNTTDHIPGAEAGAPGNINLEQFFGASGYICESAQAATIKDYGFLPVWPLSTCGHTD
jgi:ABC-type phosphate transport system substrate-binding protein